MKLTVLGLSKCGGALILISMKDWQLEQRQSLPLQAKINLSLKKIREWYEHWDGQVYVSFSGGKDSCVLLDLVRKIYSDVEVVFYDTGLEYPEARQIAKEAGAKFIKPVVNFRDVIMKYGYPVVSKENASLIEQMRNKSENIRCFHEWYTTGKCENPTYTFQRIILGHRNSGVTDIFKLPKKWYPLLTAPFKVSDRCCDAMRKNPFKLYEKQTGKYPMMGVLASESMQRKQTYIRHGCNAFNLKRPYSNPLGFWMENDILQYIKENNIKLAKVYGDIIWTKAGYKTTGVSRTGCMFCMFGVHLEKSPNKFQQLERSHPSIHKFCMKPVEEGGLGLAKVLDFINVPYHYSRLTLF